MSNRSALLHMASQRAKSPEGRALAAAIEEDARQREVRKLNKIMKRYEPLEFLADTVSWATGNMSSIDLADLARVLGKIADAVDKQVSA